MDRTGKRLTKGLQVRAAARLVGLLQVTKAGPGRHSRLGARAGQLWLGRRGKPGAKVAQVQRGALVAGRLRFGGLSVATVMVLVLGEMLAGAEEVWTIQKFMQSPPPIEKLVFSETGLGQPGMPTTYHLARWHTNGSLFRTAYSLTNLHGPFLPGTDQQICGRKGDLWWMMEPSIGPSLEQVAMFTVWKDEGQWPPPNNEVRACVEWGMFKMAEVQHMGLQRLPIGAGQWEGDRFRCLDERTGSLIEAQLVAHEVDGLPQRLDVLFHDLKPRRRKWPPASWRIEYEYGYGQVPPGLPSQITVWLLRSNEPPRALNRIRIYELVPARQALGEDLLDPRQFWGQVPLRWSAFSNNATRYFLEPDGVWRPWKTRAELEPFARPNPWRPAYLIAAGLLLLGPVAVLALWRRKARTRQEQVTKSSV